MKLINKNSRKYRVRSLRQDVNKIQIVTVNDVSPRSRVLMVWHDVIRRVHSLVADQGLKLAARHERRECVHQMNRALRVAGILGLPITTRIRSDSEGYHLYIFKRHDVTKRRGGKEGR